MVLHPNVFSYLFLASSVILFLLYLVLSRNSSKNKARKYYNLIILTDALWMLADFIQYSSLSIYLSQLFLFISLALSSFSLMFLIKLILVFERREEDDWISLIPLIALVLLFPFFSVKRGVFTYFIEEPSFALILFYFISYSLFLFFIYRLFVLRNKVREGVLKIKLTYMSLSLFTVIFSTFFYYLASLFLSLPPLTWFGAIIFVGATFPLFLK